MECLRCHRYLLQNALFLLPLVAFYVSLTTGSASAQPYSLSMNISGPHFFDHFDFFSSSDPTHGFVNYTTRKQAFDLGLVKASDQGVYIGSDFWSVANNSGRASVRLESFKKFNSGLFIINLDHMPQGCGTWPAWWFVRPRISLS